MPQRYRQRTPAMAAGLTQRHWTVQDLLPLPLPAEPIGTVYREKGNMIVLL